MRPDDETNNAFVYCLAYAASRTGVGVVAFSAQANHYHAVVVDVDGRIPRFLEDFHKLLAKHQNALRGRWENFWSTEQTSLVELVEAQDVLAKVIYALCNPVKDHLVERTHHWPGASSLLATLEEKRLRAGRPARFFRHDGHMPRQLELTCVRAPGFEHLANDEYRALLLDAITAVEIDAAKQRRDLGRKVFGRKAVLAQKPSARPPSQEPRRELDPRVAAKSKSPRIEALARLKGFRAAYCCARKAWLAGAQVLFPEGTWWLRCFAAVPCATYP